VGHAVMRMLVFMFVGMLMGMLMFVGMIAFHDGSPLLFRGCWGADGKCRTLPELGQPAVGNFRPEKISLPLRLISRAILST
jgi:hypothetical protein